MEYQVNIKTLEAFRRYLHNDSYVDGEKFLLQAIKGVPVQTGKHIIRNAFTSLLQGHFIHSNTGSFLAGDVIFGVDQALPAFRYREAFPQQVYYRPASKDFTVKGVKITLHGPVCLNGLQVRLPLIEFRSKPAQLVVNQIAESIEWRFYLLRHEAKGFYYDSFIVNGYDSCDFKSDKPYILPVTVSMYESWHLLPDPNSESKIRLLLEQFIEYLHEKNLTHLITKRNEDPIF